MWLLVHMYPIYGFGCASVKYRPSEEARRFLLNWTVGTTVVCAGAGLLFHLAGQAPAGHQMIAAASLLNLVNLRTAVSVTLLGAVTSARRRSQ